MLHKGQVRTPTSNRPRASLTWSLRVEYAGRFVCRLGRTGGRTGERGVNGASDVFIANLGAVHDDTQVAVHFDDRERDYRQRLLRVRLVLPSGGDTPAHAGIWSAPFLADTLGDVVVKVQPNAHGPAVLLKAQVCCGRTGRQRSARTARASLTAPPPPPALLALCASIAWLAPAGARPGQVKMEGATLFTIITHAAQAAPLRIDNHSAVPVVFQQSGAHATTQYAGAQAPFKHVGARAGQWAADTGQALHTSTRCQPGAPWRAPQTVSDDGDLPWGRRGGRWGDTAPATATSPSLAPACRLSLTGLPRASATLSCPSAKRTPTGPGRGVGSLAFFSWH